MNTAMPSENPSTATYEGFSDLYCATERQFRSRWIVAGYDRGELAIQPRRIGFRGIRGSIECPDVSSVEWAAKPFPWPVVALVAVVAAALAYAKSPELLAWNRPLPYLLGVILLVGSLRQWRERWIEVGYRENGQPRRVYFRRDPVFGFGGRRTRDLYGEIRATALVSDPPPADAAHGTERIP